MRRKLVFGIGILTLTLIALLAFMLTPRKRTTTLGFVDWMTVVGNFERGEWGKPVELIPSTVIDTGVLKNVPYASWRAGDYEMNIYGDSIIPACIEVGVYGESAKDAQAQKRCRAFMASIVKSQGAKTVVDRLKAEGESIQAEGYTFETTPPNAPDAYGGWWISVYSTKELDLARASDAEMQVLAVTVPESPTTENTAPSFAEAMDTKTATPSAVEASNAPPPTPQAIPDTTATLPTPPAVAATSAAAPAPQFTVTSNSPNPPRTSATDADWTPAQIARAKPSPTKEPTVSRESPSSPPSSTGSKTVYVHGYTKKNGTYVAPYRRSAPRRK